MVGGITSRQAPETFRWLADVEPSHVTVLLSWLTYQTSNLEVLQK